MNQYDQAKLDTTQQTLANASELVAVVINNIAGNEISNKMGPSTITLSSLRNLALTRFQNLLKFGNK